MRSVLGMTFSLVGLSTFLHQDKLPSVHAPTPLTSRAELQLEMRIARLAAEVELEDKQREQLASVVSEVEVAWRESLKLPRAKASESLPLFRAVNAAEVHKHTAWDTALSHVLSSSQKETWYGRYRRGESQLRDAVIRELVARIDAELLLQASQRRELEAVLRGWPTNRLHDWYVQGPTEDSELAEPRIQEVLIAAQRKLVELNFRRSPLVEFTGAEDQQEAADRLGTFFVDVVRTRKELFFSYAEVHVADLHSGAGLSKKQERTLTVAAKGSVEKQMEKWFRDFPTSFATQGPETELKSIRQDGNLLISERPGKVSAAMLPLRRSMLEHQIWTNASDQLLTQAQKDDYAWALDRRGEYRRAAGIAYVLALLDSELVLSAIQRSKMKKLLDGNVVLSENATLHAMGTYARLLSSPLRGKVEQLLDCEQRAVWKARRNDYRKLDQNSWLFERNGVSVAGSL